MAERSEKIIGGFRVLQEIQAGSGSQGTVYKAVCEDAKHGLVPVGTVVALKVMAVQDDGGAQWRKLQKRTAELSRLDHPNVVKYHGCFSEQGMFNDVHVVVQEFLQGSTLKDRLAALGGKTGLDADAAIKVADCALAGLEYTASCGLVHRDVKPGNIFVCDDGGVKLIDFEIAKQEGGTATASVGNIRGSFDYMAPDFTNPEFRGDVQSDVFSMGVVLHEALTGKTPYERLEGDDKQANFAFLSRWAQVSAGGHSPIHVSSRVRRLLAHADGVIAKALAPKREDRYRDFAEFREGLKSIRFRSLKNGGASYQLLQFIGKGGFGEVFKARERRTGALVAIKHLLKAEYAERFRREARIMKKLQDPCFVQFVDFFEMESGGERNAFLVMAFLDGMPGSSLRDAIKRRTEAPMEWRDVFVAFARYARGLLAMHQKGIFHRDIKPSNLYYPSGRPGASAIMDLGIARDVTGTATTGQVPGTLDYMPPEVVISDSRGDGGMDIYALGLCFYEALTGKMAFPRLPTGSTAYSAFFERAKARRAPAFDAPEVRGDAEILSLLEDMTNPDASRRLKNAGVLLMRIESIVRARFGDESVDGDCNTMTVAPTVAMPGGDAGTVATSAMNGAVAAELERRRRAADGGKKPFAAKIAAVVLLLAAVGAGAYFAFVGQEKPDIPEIPEKQEIPANPEIPEKPDVPASENATEAARKEIAAERAKLDEERKAEEVRRKTANEVVEKELEAKQKSLDEEAKRIAADKTKTAEEREEAEKQLKAERAKLEKEYADRKKADEAERQEANRKLDERQKSLDEQAAALEKKIKDAENAQKKAEDESKAAEEARKKAEADRIEAQNAQKAAEEETRRIAEEAEAKRLETERKAEAERKKMEARMAEMQRQLKEAEEKAAKEKTEREALEKAEAERKEREDAERKAREEAERIAREKAEIERRAEAAKIAAERKAAEDAAKRAEEKRKDAEEALRKAREEAARLAAEQRQRENAAKDLVEKAGMYYESGEYYTAVKAYRDAVKSGHSMSADELREFEDACRKADEKLQQIRAKCKQQLDIGQTPLRSIKDLDEEGKNLVDWHFDVTGR